MKTKLTCLSCGKVFERYTSALKEHTGSGSYCCLQCKYDGHSSKVSGGKNPNWIGHGVDASGYITISVGKGKCVRLHKIMAEWSIGRRLKDDEVVHHINEIKTDNRPANLRISTKSEHAIIHGVKRKLHKADVINILSDYSKGNSTHRLLGKKYNISITNIFNILHGNIWKSAFNEFERKINNEL